METLRTFLSFIIPVLILANLYLYILALRDGRSATVSVWGLHFAMGAAFTHWLGLWSGLGYYMGVVIGYGLFYLFKSLFVRA